MQPGPVPRATPIRLSRRRRVLTDLARIFSTICNPFLTALALFVSHAVTLIIASHVHQFSHFTQAGISSYVTGGLGAPLTATGPEHAFHHFLQLDVSDAGIKVDVVRFDGKPSFEDTPEVP